MRGTVVITSPRWHLSGVNTMNALLAQGLRELGFSVEILLTAESCGHAGACEAPGGLHASCLSLPQDASWPRRWQATRTFLEQRAPCVYLPGYDFDIASIGPALPPTVAIVGVLHSDEDVYYAFTQRLHSCWNAAVGVSRFLADETGRLFPNLAGRVAHIPYGVDIPDTPPVQRRGFEPLRVVFAGRIAERQKRVGDLPFLLDALERRAARVTLTIAGAGPCDEQLRAACRHHVEAGRVTFAGSVPNDELLALLQAHHVLLLLSEYEGLPLVLLEGMGRGCIPVVTDIRSGIPELVQHGRNGFRLPVGDVEGFAHTLDELQRDADACRRMAADAYATVTAGPYRVADMAASYAALFERTLDEARAGRSPGRNGRVQPPPHLRALPRLKSRIVRDIRNLLSG